ETNKLALIAPRSTINIIRDYKLLEKRKVQMPHSIVGIFKCPNLKCITNSGEEIRSLIDVIDKEKVVLKCRYCARTLSTDELVF
ncbi:MAG TPA: aspartate carbamoyltransferase regulatory subunit, partial [Nitrososphaeraceae archaeon]|nr:aspartate carbamoyltransferase regulatory subunit [Nitrososphaeraceae archaeon]